MCVCCTHEQEDRESKKLVYMCDNEHCNYSEDAGGQPGDSMVYFREEVHSKHRYACERRHYAFDSKRERERDRVHVIDGCVHE